MSEDSRWLNEVRWDEHGLVPVIVQEAASGDVLMFAWMNREAWRRPPNSAKPYLVTFAAQAVHKGGGVRPRQTVLEIRLDSDNDVVCSRWSRRRDRQPYRAPQLLLQPPARQGRWEAVEPV